MRTQTFLFSLFFALAAAILPAQSGEFQIAQRSKIVGTASFKIAATPSGFHSTSTVRLSTKGIDYAISKTERLSPARALRHAELNAVVNGSAVRLTAEPETGQLLLKISANGHVTTNKLPLHEATVLLADFDPGALENLLSLAAVRNNRALWVLLPKQSGSVEAVQLATYPDEKGTLDGKPVVVHHLIASYAGATTDLFSGPKNELLQAELPQQGFALVRKGFVLTPPAKPIAPPPTEQETAPAASASAPAQKRSN